MSVIELSPEQEQGLGPLAQLVGAWEGEKGHDIDSDGGETTDKPYRETMSFEPIGPVGPKGLYGLRYSTFAWDYEHSNSEDMPIHQELGFWFWSEEENQVVRCFTNQSGVAINAGGQCWREAKSFEMFAEVGSDLYGIASTPFMNNGCKTVVYRLRLTIESENTFSYSEELKLRPKGEVESIIHKDENTLVKIY